jgi:hypothetical protein
VAARREAAGGGLESLDAIVGTFPGTETGGASGSLAVFSVFAIALALSLRRSKSVGAGVAALVVLASLVSIGVGETKVILVLFPLAFLVMNRGEVFRRPIYFLGTGVFVTVILGGIMAFYAQQWKPGDRQVSTLDYIENSAYVTRSDVTQSGAVGRTAALYLWYQDARRTTPTFLFGYGPGATSEGKTAEKGVIAARFAPLRVNVTAASQMLWEIGVLGLAAFLAITLAAFFQALRLSSLAEIPAFHRSTLEASALMMALAAVMVPYDKSLVLVPQLQVIFSLALFQIVYWRSRTTGTVRAEHHY